MSQARIPKNPMDEQTIERFWDTHPCGDASVGGLKGTRPDDYFAFFYNYDAFRYRKERHILSCLDAIPFHGKHVLEIGLGQGADSEQIIRRGAIWSGLDLTQESLNRVTTRLDLRGLPYQSIMKGSALSIPCETDSFDIVFSHGVLHHIPEVRVAQREIARVLKPLGELIIMVYAKWSLNYLLSIVLLRRLGLLALHATGIDPGGIYGQHLANAREQGLFSYLKMENFIHRNTDGPLNPYSRVYDLSLVRQDFPDFRIVKSYRRFLHAPPLPVGWLPFERLLGWHLWVHLTPRD